MKFFIDTANLDQIREANELGVLDGVTTNPSLMAKEGIKGVENQRRHYIKICEMVDGDVSAEVIATDYEGMMELTESMFRYLAEKVCGSTKISYNGVEIDLGKPFARMTMIDAIKKYAGVDFDQVPDDAAAKKLADEHHIEYEERHKKGDIVNLFFEEYCEKELIQPTFIMDHPIEISPLTKKKPSDPTKVERFELFCNTWEMCNAYSELNDPIDQRERFAAQDANAAAGDDEAEHTDEDFLNALEIGMPPTGGIGYGIDRLVMLLTDSQAIRDVLLFPTMKSLDK